MKEAPITHSPHAYVPKKNLTEAERKELYRTRIDESFKPYTVIDVLTRVYHRIFSDDLLDYIGKHPEEFSTTSAEWNLSRAWVNELRIIRPESIFLQELEDVKVDILVETRIKMEEERRGNAMLKKRYNLNLRLRLRYSLDLRPCHLDCFYRGVILDEKDALISNNVSGIKLDRYLLPYLGEEDYPRMAKFLLYYFSMESCDKDVPFDPEEWIYAMGSTLLPGVFPDKGVQGEYFFSFGSTEIYNEKRSAGVMTDINPGTIIIDKDLFVADKSQDAITFGIRNSTIAHEGVHRYLARFFFMLQRTHGHQYCSYMCKRRTEAQDAHANWTPVDIMEMHANKLPGYLMIQQKFGKPHAEMLLESYGGERSIANMNRLVDDMAEYYHTTKTMARTRLLDFGFTEVKGIKQSANGARVPAYLSTLAKDESYTIDETEAIREYIENPRFRELLQTGRFVYVEGHYCLNDPAYVVKDQYGYYHLTHKARTNMVDCCLVFKIKYESAVSVIFNGVMRKGGGRGKKQLTYTRYDGKPVTTPEGLALRAQIAKELAESKKVCPDFNQMTKDLMKTYGFTITKLADEIGLSEETIKNMRTKPDRLFPIQEIIAICIAMHIPYMVSKEYIKVAPSKILNTEDMWLYEYALIHWSELPLRVVNRKLIEARALPLTNDVEGFDENGRMLKEG